MGRPGAKSTAVISVNVDDKGQISYDSLVKQGSNRNKIVHTSLDDIREKEVKSESTSMPAEEEAQAAADKTKLALEALLESKIRSSKASMVVKGTEAIEPTYIKYTPNPNAPG
jgi:SNW domain-containing protein 1